jgi:hypothetical protein
MVVHAHFRNLSLAPRVASAPTTNETGSTVSPKETAIAREDTELGEDHQQGTRTGLSRARVRGPRCVEATVFLQGGDHRATNVAGTVIVGQGLAAIPYAQVARALGPLVHDLVRGQHLIRPTRVIRVVGAGRGQEAAEEGVTAAMISGIAGRGHLLPGIRTLRSLLYYFRVCKFVSLNLKVNLQSINGILD